MQPPPELLIKYGSLNNSAATANATCTAIFELIFWSNMGSNRINRGAVFSQ